MFFYSKKEEEVVTFVCNLVGLSKKWLETGLKKICSFFFFGVKFMQSLCTIDESSISTHFKVPI